MLYNAPLITIDRDETRRYAGLQGNSDFPDQLLTEACREALILAKPQGCWQVYPYDSARGIIAGPQAFRPAGDSIVNHLTGSQEVAVMAVTIGPALEQAVSAKFAAGAYTAGLLLDAAGTTAVEATADALNQLLASQAALRGLKSLSRFSPGYGSWQITDQADILALASGQAISITVTPSCMLLPRKSVTAVIGLHSGIPAPITATCLINNCASCTKQNCLARKEPI